MFHIPLSLTAGCLCVIQRKRLDSYILPLAFNLHWASGQAMSRWTGRQAPRKFIPKVKERWVPLGLFRYGKPSAPKVLNKSSLGKQPRPRHRVQGRGLEEWAVILMQGSSPIKGFSWGKIQL